MMAYNQKLTSVDESNILRNPCLCYTFSLSSDGEFELELIRFLTLDSRGRIRVGIGIDGGEPFVIESDTTDEWRGRGQGQRSSPATGLLRRGKMIRARVVRKLRMVSRTFMIYEL